MIKKDQESKQKINTETYLKKKKNRFWENREYGKNKYYNMSEEKKQRLNKRISKKKKNTVRLKSLNIIINKIVLIVYAMIYAN